MSEFWENNTEARFVICFMKQSDKIDFLRNCKESKSFSIGYSKYTHCKFRSVLLTNIVRCHAEKSIDNDSVLKEIFSDDIPF